MSDAELTKDQEQALRQAVQKWIAQRSKKYLVGAMESLALRRCINDVTGIFNWKQVEPAEDTYPLPEGCLPIEGYPMLCATIHGYVSPREKVKGIGRQTIETASDIADMVDESMTTESVHDAARYLIDRIAEEAGLRVVIYASKPDGEHA